MKQNDMEKRFQTAVEHAAPDVLEQVLDGCAQPSDNAAVIPLPRRRRRLPIAILSTAAAVLLVAGSVFGFSRYTAYNRVDSVIGLDVNPSVELRINSREKVLEARALNTDAQNILDGMELRGTDLDVAVNALIGSMLKNGYISDLANSVLISVENGDGEKGAALRARLADDISRILGSSAVDGAILSQTLTEDDSLQALAQQYDISVGKASLIQEILKSNPRMKFASLAGLTINELNLLASSRGSSLDTVTAEGTASSSAYIGADRAKEIALTNAGAPEAEVRGLEIEFDCDDGRMVYEVEFNWNSAEYDYDIDALDGTLLKSHRELTGSAGSGGDIGEERAREIALEQVDAAQVQEVRVERETDDGRIFYEVTIRLTDGTCEVDVAADGTIREVTRKQTSGTTTEDSRYIGRDAARARALERAGVSEAQSSAWKIKFDFEDGGAVYEIEFYADGTKYEMDIDALTGTVLDYDTEREAAPGGSGTQLTAQQARDIALAHAGTSAENVRDLKTELDEDDGRMVYEVEFKQGGQEYEYEIDAASGDILHHKVEIDD